ncbi:hypothetical protein [uncultured Winogradskyella sp.]|uniref:hypothetical protein n=1 Tax=uncultured Winogradskyella sp. TaxID=395353 RepID=UPI00260F8008|nr:hypothetical protein [uncultured Winogradskyella sp.]
MKNLIILTFIFSLSASTFVSAQSKPTQKETFQGTYNAMKALVKSKKFKYVGEVVFEGFERERLNNEDESNCLTIEDSKATGLIFDLGEDDRATLIMDKIINYSVNFNDDLQNISIAFAVNKIKILIDIKPNGNAFLTIKNGIKDITQMGKLQAL